MKKIGILGGLGALASHRLLGYILELSAKNHYVTKDEDYPEIILHSLALKGFNEKGEMTQDFLSQVSKNLINLSFQTDVCVLACNTLHEYYELFQSQISIPLINMIDITAQSLNQKNVSDVIVFCSEQSEYSKLHQTIFNKYDISVKYAKARHEINYLIDEALRNCLHRDKFNQITSQYDEHIVLGCTELSLFYENYSNFSMTDCLYELAQYIVLNVYQKN